MLRKNTIAASILVVSAAFFAASSFNTEAKGGPVQAGWTPFSAVTSSLEVLRPMETLLTSMQTALQTGIDAMLRLSDDIGEMADRILVMADKIGEMADRIVYTEELMATTLLELRGANSSAVTDLSGGSTSSGVTGKTTLIMTPTDGQTLNATTDIQLSGDFDDFVLYVSSDAGMAQSTNILVQNGDLTAAMARISSYVSNNKIYIAAKAVDGGAVGNISNIVMVNAQY